MCEVSGDGVRGGREGAREREKIFGTVCAKVVRALAVPPRVSAPCEALDLTCPFFASSLLTFFTDRSFTSFPRACITQFT